ncbi:SusC/RagA family TonB-linked outer membrane protein [Proteiniphilum acetatigenes]|uniref:SusC/RagA family TonB-linked outer membrane protein n=1 Tax=Proteiniphilum acetatigenes TaxID=294710 RepID=UPI00039E8439|nr:TonB-dependent receptor [Proteiniphilum acetatigenes]
MRKTIMLFVLCIFSLSLIAQQLTIRGKVLDADGNALPGVTILVVGTTTGTSTDIDGDYVLNNVEAGNTLRFSFMGFVTQEFTVETGKPVINVIMLEETSMLDEVTVVAFGTQKKESVVASITTVSPSDLKMPTSNLTTSFAGQIAGMISYQSSGEPGADNADFFIRGVTSFGYNVDPLILVDNIEISKTELARIQPDDIESFSIMKDAAATALYGARGANGVILIKTKEGRVGRAQLNVRIENNISQPTKKIQLADPITYMRMHNEAFITRDPRAPLLYSDDKIENTERGLHPLLYPVTDWQSELMRDYSTSQRVNLNIRGGGNIARYYVAAAYTKDGGILKVDPRNNFNNNINLDIYTLRSNVNIDLSKTTELKVSLDGTFEDYSGPLNSGSSMYGLIMKSNPVLFPAYYPIDDDHKYVTHTLFGNAEDGQYLNPYAQMVRGYREYNKSIMGAQIELKQDMGFLLDGLSVRALFNTKREALSAISRAYSPYYYKLGEHNYLTGDYKVEIINPDASGESLQSYVEMPAVVNTTYFESSAVYGKNIDESHDINAQLVFTMRNRTVPATNSDVFTVLGSLPYRNVGLAGRASYAYQSKYFVEANFGYNGSERFSKQHRWGFFPSISGGWMVSNEKFFTPLKHAVTQLKLRGSYGLAGNDNISDQRFLYLSDVSLTGGSGYTFGYEVDGYSRPGMVIRRYADPEISWEVSYKTNLAMELTLFKDFNIIWEYFTENRKSILQERRTIPYSMGLWVNPNANLGEAKGRGTDFSVTHNYIGGKSFWIQSRVNFTYAVSEYTKYEDYDYDTEWWKLRIGNPTTQQYGYIAERLFIDEADVANSPTQFGSTQVMAGDIKYRDLNGDGVINDRDMAPIGYPTTPEIQYGFGSSIGYKSFDFSFFFNGVHRRSFWINYNTTSPFFNTTGVDNTPGTPEGNNALMKFIADSYWSEADRNPYATWPRLATALNQVSHNNHRNTWFMRDGAFLRLKSVELGYSLPEDLVSKVRVSSLRIYLSSSNLFSISKFKLWDVEMAGNGLGYPIQRTFNVGMNISF